MQQWDNETHYGLFLSTAAVLSNFWISWPAVSNTHSNLSTLVFLFCWIIYMYSVHTYCRRCNKIHTAEDMTHDQESTQDIYEMYVGALGLSPRFFPRWSFYPRPSHSFVQQYVSITASPTAVVPPTHCVLSLLFNAHAHHHAQPGWYDTYIYTYVYYDTTLFLWHSIQSVSTEALAFGCGLLDLFVLVDLGHHQNKTTFGLTTSENLSYIFEWNTLNFPVPFTAASAITNCCLCLHVSVFYVRGLHRSFLPSRCYSIVCV